MPEAASDFFNNSYHPNCKYVTYAVKFKILTDMISSHDSRRNNVWQKRTGMNGIATDGMRNAKVSQDTATLQTSKDTINETFHGEARGTLILGNNHSYRTVTLKKFGYSSKTGKMTLSMAGLDLNGFFSAENQVSFELTIRDKTYFTSGVNWGRSHLSPCT